MKIALFASGNGSNVQAIIDAISNQQLQAQIICLVCDRPEAFVIQRAQEASIPVCILDSKKVKPRAKWEAEVVGFLTPLAPDYIVLAGFMRILGSTFLQAFANKIINIHPSLLPNFPGKNGIKDAFEAKAQVTGVTIHWVDEGIDTGPIIAQESIAIDSQWTLEELESRIHQIEHRLYPQTIQKIIDKHREENY